MAISRKPKPQENGAKASVVDIDRLINRGGSVPTATNGSKTADATTVVNLRLPMELVERIDKSLKARPIKTPRHTWLLEAVIEKLERE